MTPAVTNADTLAIDSQGLEALRLKARGNPGSAVAAASKQFEALFLGMMLKGMRSATPQEGPFDSEQTRLYTSLLDQQLAQHMAKRGTGLAEVMARQLAPNFTDSSKPGHPFAETPAAPPAAPPIARPAVPPAATPAVTPAAAQASRASAAVSSVAPGEPAGNFVSRIWAHAMEAAQALRVQPRFLVGQAALESGWGRHEIRTADGQPSHNLFGIKAGGNWKGPSVEKTTTEYVNGAAVTITDKFRVYASYSESFRDYTNLLRDNARYAGVLGQGDARGFAQGLQRGGYATDPAYADKLVSVINSTREPAVPQTLPHTPVRVAALEAASPAPGAHAFARDPWQAPYSRDPAYTGGLVRAAYGLNDAAAAQPRRDVIAALPAAATLPAAVVAPPVVMPALATMALAPAPASLPAVRGAAPVASDAASRQAGEFVHRMWSHAVDAAQALGVQPQFIVGQAALKSGWGRHEIRTAGGELSHNLFGIKAGPGWNGASVDKTATVTVNGVATRVVEKFRVYASYEEGFRDYAKLLRDNARYAGVIGQGDARGFAQGLQRGGYATDPRYADKLVGVINSPPLREAVAAERRPQVVAQR